MKTKHGLMIVVVLGLANITVGAVFAAKVEKSSSAVAASRQTAKGKTIRNVSEIINELDKTARDSKERNAVLAALEEGNGPQSDKDVGELASKLDDADPKVQEVAVKVFLKTKDKRAASKLREKVRLIPVSAAGSLTSDEAYRGRVASLAALALAEMKDESVMPVIVDKLGDAPFPAAYDEQLMTLSAVTYGSGVLSDVKKKIKAVGRKNPSGKMRLLSVIMNMDDKKAAGDLRKLYASDDAEIKSAAARGLRNIGQTVDVQDLLNSLDKLDKNRTQGKGWGEARSRIMEEIGFSGNPVAVPTLKARINKEMAKGPGYQPLCYGEMLALARIGGHENYLFLEKLYRDLGHNKFRTSILDVFGRAKMKEAIPLLTEILNDNIASTEYRGTAAVNLGLITGEQQKYDRIYAKMMGWVK